MVRIRGRDGVLPGDCRGHAAGRGGGVTPSVNGASLRAEVEKARADLDALWKDRKVSEEVDAAIGVLFGMPVILIAVLLERQP